MSSWFPNLAQTYTTRLGSQLCSRRSQFLCLWFWEYACLYQNPSSYEYPRKYTSLTWWNAFSSIRFQWISNQSRFFLCLLLRIQPRDQLAHSRTSSWHSIYTIGWYFWNVQPYSQKSCPFCWPHNRWFMLLHSCQNQDFQDSLQVACTYTGFRPRTSPWCTFELPSLSRSKCQMMMLWYCTQRVWAHSSANLSCNRSSKCSFIWSALFSSPQHPG